MSIFRKSRLFALALATGLAGMMSPLHAGMAEHARRATVNHIDVVVYPMDVKDVVTMVGSMPLGDAVVASRGENPAIPELTAMMVQRGTRHQDKFAIAETLSSLGATLSVANGKSDLTVFGKSLKKDMGTVVDLLAEELREPAFDAAEFDKARDQMRASLRQRADNANSRAYEALAARLFVPGNPNMPVPREAMLKAVDQATLDQVKAFYARYYGPRHMTLVFAGDVDLARARATVAKAFDGWSGGVDYQRRTPAPAPPEAADLAVPMKDKASVSVMWGQSTGLRYTDADYLPLRVGVSILGEGFTGRLMSTVRDKEGLTYGIGASLFASDIVDGGFLMNATFAPELLDKGIASARHQLDLWWEKGVTAKELEARKQSLVGQYQLQLGNTYGMARTILLGIQRGVGLDWLDTYPERVMAVTLEQVNAAIRTHLDPSRMVFVKAGTFDKS